MKRKTESEYFPILAGMAAKFAFLLAMSGSLAFGQSLAFELQTVDEETIVYGPGKNRLTAVCFLGTECPMARAYASKLSALQDEYASRNVAIVGVMSNRQDSREDIRNYIESLAVRFPIVIDAENRVADRYGAQRTPEVYLLDSEMKLRYHGRIDDQYAPSVARADARREDLRMAIEELLAGKPVSIRETKALGCVIGKVKSEPKTLTGNEPTFAGDILAMLERNCIECHRAGEIGPFSMDRFEEVVGWADTMLETMEDGRMPPWHAAPKYGDFANARHLSESDRELFRRWIEAGCPAGDLSDLPEPKKFADGWHIEPDIVLPMRDRGYQVPRDGVVEYQYFVVDPNFQEDKWVKAAQVIPGKRDVVHHAIVFVRPPDGSTTRGVGWLSAYVPGQRAAELPKGCARKIPAGSKLVFQMHYTPNGSAREDLTHLGLQFANENEVTDEVFTLVALNQEFDIPPEDPDFAVQAEPRWLPEKGSLLAVTPHMHYRGKSCEVLSFASPPDGPNETTGQVLLRVPNYDFNWQHTYQLAHPLSLENIDRLQFKAVFDNSDANPFNPDPTEWVYWGDQSWEEMALAFYEVSIPRAGTVSRTGAATANRRGSPDNLEQVDDYVRKVLSRLDRNGDGKIEKSEGSIFVRHFNFQLFDRDGDGVATKSELKRVAESLYK